MARVGTNEWWLSVAYRGFQLGHVLVVRKGTRGLLRQRWYARCWCGWESKASGQGRADTRLWGHLYEVIQAADNTLTPRITEWPPGIDAASSLDDLYAALRRTSNAD
jgi:hypothetical protein